ncbi:MAG: hypothetical protein H6834_11875 [Planctomycetes bacterium]|nr:hypothetical protein [Planctomycetota bacterium]
MTWNQVRSSMIAIIGCLMLGAAALAGRSPSDAADTHTTTAPTADEAVVHVVLQDGLDGAAVAEIDSTFARLPDPTTALRTLVIECSLLRTDLDAVARLATAVSLVRARGYDVVGCTALPAASPWTALTLEAIGGDVLIAPFGTFRGATQAAGQPSRQEIERMLVAVRGDRAADETFQARVAVLAALFDPALALSRGTEGVELGEPEGEGRVSITRAGEPLVLSIQVAQDLLGMRYLASRDELAETILSRPAGTLLRWVSPDDARSFGERKPSQLVDPEATEREKERSAPIVRVMIHDQIDEATVSLVRRSFAIARAEGAALVVIDLKTPGGMVISMNAILDYIDDWREAGRRVVAFVNNEAASAGMVLALGCDEVFMRPGSSIGAATPVVMGPGGIEAPNDEGRTDSGEKIMSWFRTSVRTLAQKTRPGNRNAQLLAEAMVDRQIALVAYRANDGDGHVVIYPQDEYDELVKNDRILPGQGEVVARWDDETLITLTTKEAVEFGFATAQVQDFADLERRVGLIPGTSRIIEVETNWSEELVRTLGAYSFLIFLAACVLAYVEFKIPGFGLPGIGSIVCFSLLFLREYLGGMAEIPEILLFFAGAALIAVEIFLFPGTVIFGVTGALCAIVGLYLSFHNFTIPQQPWEVQLVEHNLIGFVAGLAGMTIFGLVLARYFPKVPFLGRLVSLPSGGTLPIAGAVGALASDDSYSLGRLVGREAVVVTDLHPGGRIRVDDEFVDATSEGKFLERGARVRISESQGNRVIVVPVEDEPRSSKRAPRV